MDPKTIVIAGITLTYIRTDDRFGVKSYILKADEKSCLGQCRLFPWASRPDLFTLETWCGGMWMGIRNPVSTGPSIYAKIVDGKMQDMSGKTTDSKIEPFEMHGMTYYRRTPIIVDGESFPVR